TQRGRRARIFFFEKRARDVNVSRRNKKNLPVHDALNVNVPVAVIDMMGVVRIMKRVVVVTLFRHVVSRWINILIGGVLAKVTSHNVSSSQIFPIVQVCRKDLWKKKRSGQLLW